MIIVVTIITIIIKSLVILDNHCDDCTIMVNPQAHTVYYTVELFCNVETSGRLSPTSSVYSAGPEIPSAPVSPWNSDFYESEFEPELREITSKAHNRPHSGGTKSSANRLKCDSIGKRDVNQAKQTTYFTFPVQTKASVAVVDAAPTLSEKSKKDLQNTQGEKDLFALARKRRANAGSVLEARSASLGDNLEKILSPTGLEPLGKSLSFDLGPRENFSKGPKSSSSSR